MNKLKRRIKGLKIFSLQQEIFSMESASGCQSVDYIFGWGRGGVGGTPLYDLYGNVALDRVRVSNPHSLKWSLYMIF